MFEAFGATTVYRSYTPDGRLWCETTDAGYFLERCDEWTGPEPLTSEMTIASRNFNLIKD